jgi:hypothetical protein
MVSLWLYRTISGLHLYRGSVLFLLQISVGLAFVFNCTTKPLWSGFLL